MQREFRFSRVFNFRDVGGYPGQDGRRVRWRRLFRSGTLANLADEDRPAFEALGIRTVVDLRRSYELERQGRVPEWNDLAYHNIAPDHREWTLDPYLEGDGLVRYLADRYHELADQGAAGIAAAIGVIAEEKAAPVVVHCLAGKDRTGVVCALTLSLLGVADDHVDADYALSTDGNQRFVDWARGNGYPDMVMQPWFYSPAGAMRTFLAELRERHGSVERYLTGAGLEADQLTALRRHLLA